MYSKQQSYDISASFLVPAYDFPAWQTNEGYEIKSHFLCTQTGQTQNGSIAIDVWLVKASKENPQESMIESLRTEVATYAKQLETVSKNTPVNMDAKRSLERGKAVFEKLLTQAQNPVYRKQPDAEFMKLARYNLAMPQLKQFGPDVEKHLYLAGLSRYNER